MSPEYFAQETQRLVRRLFSVYREEAETAAAAAR
jgi:hypothetical protein